MKKALLLLASLLLAVSAEARVSFSSVLGNNMVLQQKSNVKLWGKALPGKTVTLTASWAAAPVTSVADEAGNWEVTISTPSYGGPYTITASDSNKAKDLVALDNIMIGEVWLCSGQSNMEMMVKDVKDAQGEIENASTYPSIRLLRLDRVTSVSPVEEAAVCNGGWQVCSSETIPEFSALAFFFARKLYDTLGIPVGLVETCWGGTVAETWTSAEWVSKMPSFARQVEKVSGISGTREEIQARYDREIHEWNDEMRASYDVIDESKTQIAYCPKILQEQGFDLSLGLSYFRKTVEIPAEWEGKDITLDLQYIDDFDFTFYGGEMVGHTEDCSIPRSYTVPGSLVKPGPVEISIRMFDTGGLGGMNGDPARFGIKGPDGAWISLAGDWKYNFMFTADKAPVSPVNYAKNPNYPTLLYNSMIYPLLRMKIKGAIWYQGESNAERYDQYAELMPLMITNWRKDFGYDFPFYFCQLANFQDQFDGVQEPSWARVREAQQKCLQLQKTGMACLIDIGEARDIHPKNKQEAARRLALIALAKTYARDFVYSGPVYKSYITDGKSFRIKFDHTDGGLFTEGISNRLEGFFIAGADHIFHKAEAKIDGSSVVVSSPEVDFPVAVRYGWASNPVCNLYNGAGLPAVPFRTDTWPAY